MAISANTTWEVRTTGSDTNGGGWVPGSSGTDWTQQASAQYSVTDAVTGASSTVTSATANFGTDVVGNLVYLSGGTLSLTAGWYQITGRTNSTTITIDRNEAGVSTGVTLKIGGALATVNTLVAQMAAGNRAFVKQGTYTTTATISGSNAIEIWGYNSTRMDNSSTRPTLQATTNSNIKLFNINADFKLGYFILDGNNLTGSVGIGYPGGTQRIYYTKIINCKSQAHENSTGLGFEYCEATANSGSQIFDGARYYRCWVHDNTPTTSGIHLASGGAAIECISSNNTGASTDGFYCDSNNFTLVNCVSYNNGQHGCNADCNLNNNPGVYIKNNIFAKNGGYGLNSIYGNAPAFPQFDGNAYWNNTSGARNNADQNTAPYNINPWTNLSDVTLTGDPFTAAGSNDFTLNNTAGAGAACRAAGLPGGLPGITQTGKLDMGALQHADPTPPVGSSKVIQAFGSF